MRETRDEKLATIQSLNAKLMDAKRQLAATPGNLCFTFGVLVSLFCLVLFVGLFVKDVMEECVSY